MPTKFLGLSQIECNRSIYRIISFERLCDFFESQTFTFIHPTKWEDPFENYLANIEYEKNGTRVDLIGRKDMYGSCWTQHGTSDAMWRIYSSDKESVLIRTTPNLMLTALDGVLSKNGEAEAFIGKVQYVSGKQILQEASERAIDLYENRTAESLAECFLFKRNPFSHEAEVRLLYANPQNCINHDKLVKVPMNPHDIIQTILVDPRASDDTVRKYKEKLKSAFGYERRITKSTIYNKLNTQVIDLGG